MKKRNEEIIDKIVDLMGRLDTFDPNTGDTKMFAFTVNGNGDLHNYEAIVSYEEGEKYGLHNIDWDLDLDFDGEQYEKWEPTPLKDWSEQNHLYLSDELLDNVDKWLREISTHNYEKNAKKSWKEYLDSDHEEDFPTQRTLEEMLGKRGRAEVILDKIKHTGDINEINELTKELDELNKNNINGVDKEMTKLGHVTFNEDGYVFDWRLTFSPKRYIGVSGPEAIKGVTFK